MLMRLMAVCLVVGLVLFATEPARACYGCAAASKGCCPGQPNKVCWCGAMPINNPKVYISHWNYASDPMQQLPRINAYFGYVNGTSGGIGGSEYLATVEQYWTANDLGILKGNTYTDTTQFVQNPPTPAEINAAVLRAAQAYGVTGDTDAIILLLTDVNRCNNPLYTDGGVEPCRICGAYHSEAPNGSNPTIPFIDLSYQADLNCAGNGKYAVDYALFHELVEAVTDPRPSYGTCPSGCGGGWVDDCGCEVVDKCGDLGAWPPKWVPLNHEGVPDVSVFRHVAMWSNAAWSGNGGCVYADTNKTDSFYRSANSRLFFTTLSGGWTDWGNNGTALTNGPGAVSWGWKRLDAFVPNTAGTMSHAYSNDNGATHSWDDWGSSATHSFYSSPDVASWGPRRLDVVVAGNNRIYPGLTNILHRGWDDGVDTGWQWWASGSVLPAAVAVASPRLRLTQTERQLDVVYRGFDGRIWHGVSTDGTTGPSTWEDLGNGGAVFETGSEPDAASWGKIDGKGRLDVVIADTSGNVWLLVCANMSGPLCSSGSRTWYNPWGHPPGVTLTRPSIAQLGDLRSRITAKGSDNNEWSLLYDFASGTWTNWSKGSSNPVGGPDVASW